MARGASRARHSHPAVHSRVLMQIGFLTGFADVCHILNPHKEWGAAKTQIAKKQL